MKRDSSKNLAKTDKAGADGSAIDDHGQPLISAFCERMVTERQIDELIGMCKGVLADGTINDQEAKFLLRWLETNRSAAEQWPGTVLYSQIRRALMDGTLSEEEERDLIHLLCDFTGGALRDLDAISMSTALPLCNPAPSITFAGKSFCLTGKFMFGARSECETAITERNGDLHASPRRNTSYVVIGLVGSRDWIHSTYGRKIERAVELRENDTGIAIVSEEHWAKHL